ncbi:BREX-2 system phosphatase PglZ [Thiohalocapsa halophila]
MSVAPTPAQIRAQVAAVLDKLPQARVVGIRAPLTVEVGESLHLDGRELPVARSDSVLDIRERLDALADGASPLVLLTTVDEAELGADLLARLARRRLFAIEPWQLVKDRFSARWVDPQLVARQPWVARALLDAEPPAGYPPAPGGFLQADLVWRILFDALLGLRADEQDAEAWIDWSLDPDRRRRTGALAPLVLAGLGEAVERGGGAAARTVFDCATGPRGGQTLAVGLVARVLFADAVQGESAVSKATGKLEALLGTGSGTGELAAKNALLWADAAESVAARRLARMPLSDMMSLLKEADDLLTQLGGAAFAHHSRFLPLGFRQRLEVFAAALSAAVAGKKKGVLEGLEAAMGQVLDHALADHEPARMEAVTMSTRLARWLVHRRTEEPAPASSFGSAAEGYRYEGGFLDWARARAWDGDPLPALGKAYSALWKAVSALREVENRRFGELLAGWTKTGSNIPSVIRVEHVLDRVATPLAAAHRLLLVVVDGMGIAVFRELQADLLRQGWVELDACDERRRLPVIAALPTVTEVSRTSLLCGALRVGNQNDEKTAFAAHVGLVSAGARSKPPLLFHKGELAGDGGGVSSDVLDAVADDKRRVVGAVINAVDDHLAKGDQIRMDWTVRRIKPLEDLLAAARDTGRALILVSDHGHVPEQGTKGGDGDAAERWREATGTPRDDEVLLSGHRVLLGQASGGGKAVIAPWSERSRYSAKKNGYHGGASPQEVVIPLGVFAAADVSVAGWREVATELPGWWTADEAPKAVSPKTPGTAPVATPTPKPRPPLKPGEQGQLFPLDGEAESGPVTGSAPPPTWIDRLLASDLLAEQRRSASRVALTDERLRAMLEALDERGGKITRAALATRIGIPSLRIGGAISALRRMLNVDGYAVLSVDEASDTVELNRAQLMKQFGLDR